ncbi:MAG: DUF3881 family protein [Lachnospiraceae bacterium]
MHKYMRAIGFSQLEERKQLKDILKDTIASSTNRDFVTIEDKMLGEYSKSVSSSLGVAISGDFDENNKFIFDYYYPYIMSDQISSSEDVSVERHASKYSYAGLCDDPKISISIIFYLQNYIEFLRNREGNQIVVKNTTVSFSGLSLSGMVLLPIQKSEIVKRAEQYLSNKKVKLVKDARNGSEDAIETLTLDEMETFSKITRRLQNSDLYSVVDSTFIPYGLECDLYMVLGYITDVRKEVNAITNEEVYILSLMCNEIAIDVGINTLDLEGEPEIGRRFKGVVWLQGQINYV